MKKIFKLAIVEDDLAVRKILEKVFARTPDFQVVAVCQDAESALRQFPQCLPDLALMDINLPGMSGIDCLRILKAILPVIRIVMLTGYEDDERIFNSLVAGADGYLLKPSNQVELLEAVRGIVNGGAPISPPIARRMIDYFHKAKNLPPQGVPASVPLPELATLTGREKEVLGHLANGSSVKEVASVLEISWETVRNHIANIYDKLHVHSRTEAVLKYLGQSPGSVGSPPGKPAPR